MKYSLFGYLLPLAAFGFNAAMMFELLMLVQSPSGSDLSVAHIIFIFSGIFVSIVAFAASETLLLIRLRKMEDKVQRLILMINNNPFEVGSPLSQSLQKFNASTQNTPKTDIRPEKS
jgi:hypothetical protein